MAGWYPGRNVDISGLLLALGNKNIMFNSNSEEFWREYYGSKDTWYFKWKDAKGKVHIGGWDFSFDTDVPRIYPIHFETSEDFQEELIQIPKEKRQCVVPICEIGFHDPGVLWMDDNSQVFWTLYYKEEALVFDSPFTYLQSELEGFGKQSELFMTFDYDVYISWWRTSNRK